MENAPERLTPESILRLRQSLRLTQEQFAAKLGVTFSTVNRWEKGRGRPSPLAAKRIAELQSQEGAIDE